jgi:hypothetical protein
MREIDTGTEASVWWTHSGIDFMIEEKSDPNGSLKNIWTLKQNEFQKRYGADSIGFQCLPGGVPTLIIKYWNKPLTWLLSASPSEKAAFAKTLHEDFLGVCGFMAEAFEECGEAVLQKVK